MTIEDEPHEKALLRLESHQLTKHSSALVRRALESPLFQTSTTGKWPLMSPAEIHAFGIEAILPSVKKEGVAIVSVNRAPFENPQIVGQRWDSPAFIYVQTALYPNKGALTEAQFMRCLGWAIEHGATAFFASVGLAVTNLPDKSPVTNDADMRLPFRNAGFAVAYEGLVIMTTTDRVRVLGQSER